MYHEAVYIDKDHITVRGMVEENEWPVMDGKRVLNDAILYSGNNITIEWLKIMSITRATPSWARPATTS